MRHTYAWKPSALPAGDYAVALQAFDGAGRELRRTAAAPGRLRLTIQAPPPPPAAPPPSATGVFPVAGEYSFGGAGRALRRGPRPATSTRART